jgi:hypothetical protein
MRTITKWLIAGTTTGAKVILCIFGEGYFGGFIICNYWFHDLAILFNAYNAL